MISRAYRFAALALAVACAPVLAQDNQASNEQPSQAETLLFETDHLRGITKPTTLTYTFTRQGTMESAFQDTVDVSLKPNAKNGTSAISTRYLSGDREEKYEPFPTATGNLVIKYFLEHDAKEMKRLTGGQPNYFIKRIRLALVEKADVRPVKFAWGGKEVSGTEIRISPYLDDPNKAKFGKVSTTKYYVFTLSDQVPGGVYQIRAVVPDEGAAADGKPLIDETLTFSKVTSLQG